MMRFENQDIEFRQEYTPSIKREVVAFINAGGGTARKQRWRRFPRWAIAMVVHLVLAVLGTDSLLPVSSCIAGPFSIDPCASLLCHEHAAAMARMLPLF